MLWRESDPQLCRCVFTTTNRAILVKQVTINANGLLFVTQDGEAFQSSIKTRRKKTSPVLEKSSQKSAFHKFLDREDCVGLKLSKFARIHRAVYITSDVKGLDFCVIQQEPYKKFKIPDISPPELSKNLGILLQECHEMDDLHDIVFQVGCDIFPAHRCIVAAASGHFNKLLLGNNNQQFVSIDGYHGLIFEQFLLFCYTGHCDLVRCGECPQKLRIFCPKYREISQSENVSAFEVYNEEKQKNKGGKIKNPVRLLHEMAKKFSCFPLCEILANYDMNRYMIVKKKNEIKSFRKEISFDRVALEEFYDVTIRCSDDKEVRAHKCILAAQSDYFVNLFSTRWAGVSYKALFAFSKIQVLTG